MLRNCWEFKACGRQPGGDRTDELGVCTVATCTMAHGINDGINGGRACWTIEGSLCGSKIQGNFSQKIGQCMSCDFYARVRQEQGQNYTGTKKILDIMKHGNDAGQRTVATPQPTGRESYFCE